MSLRVVNHLPEGRWRRFAEDHPDGSVFHTPEMFQVFARTESYRPTLWAAVDESSDIQALLLPVEISLSRALRRLTTRAVVNGSVLYVPGQGGLEALSLLLATYRQEIGRSVLFTELRNLRDLTEAQPTLVRGGFAYEDHLNYLIDLDRPADQVLRSIGRRTRTAVRKGLREEVVQVTWVRNAQELDQWYAVLQSTYARTQVPVADRSLFEAVFDVLVPKDMAMLLSAKVGSKVAACDLILLYKDTMYGWYGGVDRAYARYHPNELLTWFGLRWGTENGYRVFDFGGAGKPDEEYGVRDYKAKFHGELVCYGRNTCVHAPVRLRLAEYGYRLLRRWL